MILTASIPNLFLAAAGASALGGALGMASGIFIVPILTFGMGMDVHAAIGTSLISVIACSCGGAAPFLREGLTNVRLASVLETATTLGAAAGVLLSGILPVPLLYALFAAVLLASAWQMSVRRTVTVLPTATAAGGWRARLDGSYPDRVTGGNVLYRVQRLPLGLGLMFGAGLLSALLGIGSGVLKIPAMDTALRLPLKVSSATSGFMIGVTAAASAGAYFLRGYIVTPIAAPVALGSVLGAMAGTWLLMIVPADRLRIVFAAVLVLLALQMAWAAWTGGAPRA